MTPPSEKSSGKSPDKTGPQPLDWLLLGLIVVFGGSAFAGIRLAVETVPPAGVGVMRIWVGALTVYLIMRQAGRRLPPLFQRARGRLRLRRAWRYMIAVGLIGNCIPFFLFPWAQQFIESGLAGIFMAFMPIWTLVLAYGFAGEALTRNKIIGIALGFTGIVILMGPGAIAGAIGADIRAQIALLIATLGYAASAVLSRRAPAMPARSFSAGMMIVAAIAAAPALLFIDLQADQWSIASIAAVIGLGLFPTGINAVLIVMAIRRVGAGFMAFSNYLTPVWAVALGAAFFGERVGLSALLALGLILAGVAISQRRS